MRNAEVVCTLGPASFDRGTVRGLANADMSVARMNASHGNVEHRSDVIDSTCIVDDATDEPLAAMLDPQGPEIRIADTGEDIYFGIGSEVRSYEGDEVTPEAVGLSCSITAAGTGDTILLDDGRIEVTVEYVEDNSVYAAIVSDGEFSSRGNVSAPSIDLDIDLIIDSDYGSLKFAAEKEADHVAALFIRDAEGVYTISDILESLGAEIPIIAKIECAGAVDNLDEIIQAAHGVMIVRGNLDVEYPLEEVPIIQKRTIRRVQIVGVPIITTTEMFDSMARSRRPVCVKASDVVNVALDGTDAMMLSGETAVGNCPVRVAEAMSRIAKEAEASPEYDESQGQRIPAADEGSRTKALARSTCYPARDVNATTVAAISEPGHTVRRTMKLRLGMLVVAIAPNDWTCRQLTVSQSVSAQYAGYSPSVKGVMNDAVTVTLDADVAEPSGAIVVPSGMTTELEGTSTTDMLKIHVTTGPVATGWKIVGGRVTGLLYRTEDDNLADAPGGTALALPSEFDGEFDGDTNKLTGIVDARVGMTGYPALVMREPDTPIVSGAPLPKAIVQGVTVTLHAERDIIYEGDIINRGRGSR